MSEGNNQTVTITHGQITMVAAGALVLAALISSVTLGVAVSIYDRGQLNGQRMDNLDERVRTLEAYEAARTKDNVKRSLQGDSVRQ